MFLNKLMLIFVISFVFINKSAINLQEMPNQEIPNQYIPCFYLIFSNIEDHVFFTENASVAPGFPGINPRHEDIHADDNGRVTSWGGIRYDLINNDLQVFQIRNIIAGLNLPIPAVLIKYRRNL